MTRGQAACLHVFINCFCEVNLLKFFFLRWKDGCYFFFLVPTEKILHPVTQMKGDGKETWSKPWSVPLCNQSQRLNNFLN
ncbi:hypothetical protein scyTo_0016206 [Scyliorhinus torazame]|uniref:Uncharacterized protein n=1 Tax=Scyliorhinus torazame TaxID=75743 RepID=A0A401Q520_SCYTO|nr:hypothetical protein [Scyliorhinus torazame]